MTGPLTLLFCLYFGPRIRRDMVRSFVALEAEVARRREAGNAVAR